MAGMDGQWIYHNFQDGQGPDGLVGGAAIVNEVAADYDTRAQQIRSLMTRMESAWQGDAAGAAHRGAGPMANEHELSGPSLATAQDLTNRQAGSYTDAKNAVVPVPPKPELSNPLVVFTSPAEWTRFEDQVDDYNAAAQHNVDVMNRYGGASAYNIRELPTNYGTLTTDQAGIGISPDTTIDSEDFGDASGDSGGPGDPGGGSPSPRPTGGDTDGAVSGGGAPSPGGGSTDTATRPDAGTTTPGGFTPSAPTPFSPVPGGTDSGVGTSRPLSGLVPGVGVVAGPGAGGSPGGGSGSGSGPGGGRGGGAGPRGGVVRGPGVGAEPPGPTGRSGPSAGVAGATGRGSPGMSGVPIGAAGRGRDGEDSERKRPAYLEGGDPDELFDTDEKTAPPAIGEDDDD